MKTITKLMLASSALVGGIANAQINVMPTAPGGSDLVLFVTDTATGAAFVQDLGVNVDSLGVTTASVTADFNASPQNSYSLFGNFGAPGPMGSGGTISVGSGLITSGGIDTQLASFESTAGCTAATCTYSIIGAAAGDGSTNTGQGRFVATMTPTLGLGLFNGEPGSSQAAGAASSTTQFFQAVNAGTAVFDYTPGPGQQAQGNFALGGGGNGASLGVATAFYEAATFGPGNDANIYASTDNITVGLNGAITGLTSGGTAPVPLPAAVWLLGSGVLGLLGIGRRRSSATVAV